MPMNTFDLIEPSTRNQEWLFRKMAGRFEGWAIKDEGRSIDVPLNALDYFAVRILAKTIEKSHKTVLALPRTTPGVALSLVSYLTVNRFVVKESKGARSLGLLFDGFKPIPMDTETPVVVVTKNRRLRDYYLSSELNFSGQVFPFKDFPLYRIKRSSDLTPLHMGSANPQLNIAPIVFYHLDELEKAPRAINNAVVLVELDTLTTYNTLNRLEQFLTSISPSAVMVVCSTFSTPTLFNLKGQGYDLVLVRPENVLKFSNEKEGLPSFSSSIANIPSLTEVHGEVIQGESIDSILHRLTKQFNEISKTLGSDLPSVFYAARTLLATLKNLAVPLSEMEQTRKSDASQRTIKHLLEKIFTNHYLELTPSQEAVIRPAWDAIGADFFEVYKKLDDKNPKYELLVEKIASGSITHEGAIIFYDSLQPAILKRILADELDAETFESVLIASLNDVDRHGIKANKILLPGMWRAKDEATVVRCMPEDIDMLLYTSELSTLKSSIKRLQDIPLTDSAVATLHNLDIEVEPENEKTTLPWIALDPELQKVIDLPTNYRDPENEDEDELPDSYYYDEHDTQEVDLIDEPDEESYEVFIIETDTGENVSISATRDVLVYSEDSQTVRSISPENVSEGDMLLALDGEHSREIFQEIAARTKDLAGANSDIMTSWERALFSIRRIRDNDGEQILIDMLRMLKCEKTDTTIRQWIKGVTLAPQDTEDVAALLKIAGVASSSELAPSICGEVDKVRKFHRRLGKRLRSKLGEMARGDNDSTNDLIDIEIDEILDLVHLVKVERIEGPIKPPAGYRELLVLG